jgi:L-fuconolactonase
MNVRTPGSPGVNERSLMSGTLEIIDSHFHVWDLARQNLPWLAETNGAITRTYTIDELASRYEAIGDVTFLGGVYVEVDSDDPLLEDEIARGFPQDKVLALMLRSRVSPWMRVPIHAAGVREPLHVPSSPKGRCREASFVEGLRALAGRGLPFESCNRVGELGDLYEALARVPEETVILNHLGNVQALDERYLAAMRRLATLPNLYVKVSGFPTADRAFVNELLGFAKDTFSPERLLYASNWPVVELYSTFEENLAVLREAFADDERFFRDNAMHAYGISL